MAKKIITIILTALVSVVLTFGAIMKFAGAKSVVEPLTKLGVGNYIPILGTMEMIFLILFLFPVTRKIGLLLLSCYFGGAIATHISHGESVFAAMPPIILIWIVAYLKDPSIFLSKTNTPRFTFEKNASVREKYAR